MARSTTTTAQTVDIILDFLDGEPGVVMKAATLRALLGTFTEEQKAQLKASKLDFNVISLEEES